jgi:hypothetical protein
MTTFDCLEWGKNDGSGTDVVAAEPGDTINFPHVDSCLAVVFLRLNLYVVVGGHAAVTTRSGKFGFRESLTEMVERMAEKFNGDLPQYAAFIGAMGSGSNDWPVNAVIDEKKQLFKNIQIIPFSRSETTMWCLEQATAA